MLNIDESGWFTGVRRIESPNCDDRPPGQNIDLVVVHAISLPPRSFGTGAIARLFTNQLDPAEHPYYASISNLRVSAHLLVERHGSAIQFVPLDRRAWHAGVSCWRARQRCNDFSIGIELEGSDDDAFEDVQYETLAALISAIRKRHSPVDLAGHSDVAPGRKSDPGPHFDWARLHRLLGD